jgi:WD40 repeat protein
VWWILTTPRTLRLQRILEPPPESRNELAEIKGYSPDGSLLAVQHALRNSPRVLAVRHIDSDKIAKLIGAIDLVEVMAADQLSQSQPGFFHAFSPDGGLFAVGLEEGNVIKVLDTVAWKEKAKLSQTSVFGCRFLPDGKTLLIETTRGFTVWDVRTARRLATMEQWCQGGLRQCWIAPDGRELMAIELLEAREGEEQCTWRIGTWDASTWELRHEVRRRHPDYSDFRIAPDGQRLVAVSSEGRIEIEEPGSGENLATLELPDSYADHALWGWGADGHTVLVAGADGNLWIWDSKTPKALLVSTSLDQSPVSSSVDGKLLATEQARLIPVNFWILQLPTVLQGPASWCFGKPHSSHPPSQVSVRNMSTGHIVARATLDSPWVTSLVFSPDGSSLAVADSHGHVLLYNVRRQPR